MLEYSEITVPALLAAGNLLLIAAALHNLAARTIPDAIAASIACIGALLRLHEGTMPGALFAAALVLAVALLACHRGWMGGGDVKLLGAVALLLPPDRLLASVSFIAIVAALLAVPYVALRGSRRVRSAAAPCNLLSRAWRVERFRLSRGGPLPYGVAIAIGTILALPGVGT